MKIQRISFITNNTYLNKNNNINTRKTDDGAGSIGYVTIPYYNDIAFQARVDKSLTRFFEANKGRMPKTVKNFVEKLPDQSNRYRLGV